MKAALLVVAPGLLTTVQDLGRPGFQCLGVPVSGALDHVSLCAANTLVGNPHDMGALEIAYQGPALAVDADSVRVAAAGAQAAIDIVREDGSVGHRLAPFESARLVRGQTVRIGPLTGSAILYLAIEGGLDIPPVMGSQSTLTRGGIGGFAGRGLRAGDVLPLRRVAAEEREEVALPPPDLAPPTHIRIVLGPQDDHFSEAGLRTLLGSPYTISRASDRMGMRLEGPMLEHSAKGFNIISDGIALGSIQVPGNGLPIILLADRQTTGGYPKVATVISADMPALGRMTPGSEITFRAVDIETAEAAARQLGDTVRKMSSLLVPARRQVVIDPARLLRENLISGAIDARSSEA